MIFEISGFASVERQKELFRVVKNLAASFDFTGAEHQVILHSDTIQINLDGTFLKETPFAEAIQKRLRDMEVLNKISGTPSSIADVWKQHEKDDRIQLLAAHENAITSMHNTGQFAFDQRNSSHSMEVTFSEELTAEQLKGTLDALADFYRNCGGSGFEISFEFQDVSSGVPALV